MGGLFTKSRLEITRLTVCLCLIAITVAVYWPLRNQEFINYDDDLFVTENHYVLSGLTAEGVVWAFTDWKQVGFWIPVTWLSLMLDGQLYNLHAGGYKMTNLLLHLANILLLFYLLNRMTGNLWRSAFVAALFAIHPLHVESVAWVTERKDVLSTLFWMLTMWAYLEYVDHPRPRRYLLIALLFALGLMAKPMLVTLPFVLLIMDYWPLNRLQLAGFLSRGELRDCLPGGREPVSLSKLVVEKLPLFVLAVVASAGTILAHLEFGAVATVSEFSVGGRTANILVSYVIYIWKNIWPSSLGLRYPFSPLPFWPVAGAGLILVVISTLALRLYRRKPYLLVGWLWYLGTLLPVIGVVQIGTAAQADRFTYVPSIGLYIMISWGIPPFLAGWRHRRLALSLAATLLLAMAAVVARLQVELWDNSIRLFEHTLRVTQGNDIIENNLGGVLLDQGRYEEAAGHFFEALRINPGYEEAHNNLRWSLVKSGRVGEAGRIYSEAMRLNPNHAIVRKNLGDALAMEERFPEASVQYSEAIRLNPNYATAHNDLAIVLQRQGKNEEAVLHFSEALQLEPDHADIQINLGMLLMRLGRAAEAAAHFSRALEIVPEDAEAHKYLGIALSLQGRTREAESHFSEAVRLNPDLAGETGSMGGEGK